MAIRLIPRLEVLVLLMHAVRRALLPLVDACRALAAGLIFVHFGDLVEFGEGGG